MPDLIEVKVAKLPKCSFCGEKAEYDFQTTSGQWGYGCTVHYALHRAYDTLGTGKGQKLVLKQPEVKHDPLSVGAVLNKKK